MSDPIIKIAQNIEYVLETQVERFVGLAKAGMLKDFDVKTLETLAKITSICKMWRNSMPSKSKFDNLSVEDLAAEFGEDDFGDNGGGKQ